MPTGLNDDFRVATELTAVGRLMEATAVVQRRLGAMPDATVSPGNASPMTIDGVAERLDEPAVRSASGRSTSTSGLASRLGLGDLVRSKRGKAASPASQGYAPPEGAAWLSETFTNDAGLRPYKLYVPGGYQPGHSIPLVVMLHGCTQSPDDFAAGTRMNEAAEAGTFLVAYPGQTKAANMQGCWNWFSASDQGRGAGEPSVIAGITRHVMAAYDVDPRRVFVAGLSAGGAMAAIMGNAYPDLYAAVGVHSGLASGAAHDMPSAFAAMRSGSSGSRPEHAVPSVVFHGSKDSTVNPANADAVLAQAAAGLQLRRDSETGQVPGGHRYTRVSHIDHAGRTVAERWDVQGAGHAWSGGSKAGSYTDPHGPDATAEMVRFFLEHPAPR